MKREEKNVLAYLKSTGHTDITYELNGNRTPNFSINNAWYFGGILLQAFNEGVPLQPLRIVLRMLVAQSFLKYPLEITFAPSSS